jgi:hypothetical protein
LTLSIKIQKHNQIKKNYLDKIISLKEEEWSYSKNSQNKWIKNNLYNTDIHVTLEYKKKVIGYTMLRDRLMFSSNKSLKKIYFFDTHIIDKKFRGKPINNIHPSKILMDNISNFLKRKKRVAFLLCKKNLIKYYKSNNWEIMNKNKIRIKNGKKLTLMSFGKFNKNKNFTVNV